MHWLNTGQYTLTPSFLPFLPPPYQSRIYSHTLLSSGSGVAGAGTSAGPASAAGAGKGWKKLQTLLPPPSPKLKAGPPDLRIQVRVQVQACCMRVASSWQLSVFA